MPLRVLISLVCLSLTAWPLSGWGLGDVGVSADRESGQTLGHPGYLIISAARDSSAGFKWLEGPGPHQISMTWLDGMLTLPDSLVLEPFGEFDLAVPVSAQFSGAGASGKLDWKDGTFAISEPVMITDGAVGLLVSEGELEILGTRIRYRAPEVVKTEKKPDPRASLFMLAGIMLLIAVLLRRARRKIKEGP